VYTKSVFFKFGFGVGGGGGALARQPSSPSPLGVLLSVLWISNPGLTRS
jgi:hypothetical protein